MVERLVVIGAGGFGRETLDVVEAINRATPTFDLAGVVDGSPSDINLGRLRKRGIAYLGTEADWLSSAEPTAFTVGIGNSATRRLISHRFVSAGHYAATLIHPHAHVGSVASIGDGSVICGGVHVSTNVTLGRHVHLNPNATIGHDSVLSDYVSVNPAAVVSGEVFVDEDALIGAAATILQGLRVGAGAIVGAGACVVRDVSAGVTVKGVPAR